jgi:16S rRNA (guanine966-N2)-methyltransferase
MKPKSSRQIEYQIIAGTLKGRQVLTPDLGVTRPPLTRLRRSIFDFLSPYLPGASYLDLYAGTGSYLFEATSRGVATAVGVELEPPLAEAINDHAKKFGVADHMKCLCNDVFVAIPTLSAQPRRFSIIMMAPPQYKGLIDRTLTTLHEHPCHSADGMIICQHDTSETKDIDFSAWPVLQQRKYGNTTFTVLKAE